MQHEQDRERLTGFLRWVHGFVLRSTQEPPGQVPEELRDPLASAGLEFKETYDLEGECRKIRIAPSGQLRAAGLVGAQLDLKLGIVDHWKGRFLGGEGVFGKLIDAIDTLLDSLIGAAGLASALKELKDALRSIVE